MKKGYAITAWHQANRFCGVCGTPTEIVEGKHVTTWCAWLVLLYRTPLLSAYTGGWQHQVMIKIDLSTCGQRERGDNVGPARPAPIPALTLW
jgi:hypothetical protein